MVVCQITICASSLDVRRCPPLISIKTISNPEPLPTGPFAPGSEKKKPWGCRVEKEIESRTPSEEDVHRKDGTSETKLVKVLWARNGMSLGNLVEY